MITGDLDREAKFNKVDSDMRLIARWEQKIGKKIQKRIDGTVNNYMKLLQKDSIKNAASIERVEKSKNSSYLNSPQNRTGI